MQIKFERDRSAGYLTNWAARLFARVIDRKLKPFGLSSGQLPVFFALSGTAALTQKALAEAAAIEQPTMAATLVRMERDGLILRQADPRDGRSALVSLTPDAIKKAPAVLDTVHRSNAEALAGLDGDERDQLLRLLRRVIDNLEKSDR
jgi:MarR family transcriptional regulator, transcriptional regulator for hemolysin